MFSFERLAALVSKACKSDLGEFYLHCYHVECDRLSKGAFVDQNCRNRYVYTTYRRCCRCQKVVANVPSHMA